MANDSVTDEPSAHQSQSPETNRKILGSDVLAASKETTFHLHLTYHDWLLLGRLLAVGNLMSQEAAFTLAHEWRALSGRMASALSHVDVQFEVGNKETTSR